MHLPDFITFTGADDQTSVGEMIALSEDYPGRIEFALLVSPKRAGTPRYPTDNWRNSAKHVGLRLALHFCGDASRDVITTGQSRYEFLDLDGISRVQINTADPAATPGRIREWADRVNHEYGYNIQPILQCRGTFPPDNRVSWLFDQSGGTGIEPDAWPIPHPDSGPIGYAGGIGPHNVCQVIERLPQFTNWWIDMESRIRNAEDRLDLGLCRQVCEAVYGAPREAAKVA